jgi:hypothetical protein
MRSSRGHSLEATEEGGCGAGCSAVLSDDSHLLREVGSMGVIGAEGKNTVSRKPGIPSRK